MTAQEELARQAIDQLLTAAGAYVQDLKQTDLHGGALPQRYSVVTS